MWRGNLPGLQSTSAAWPGTDQAAGQGQTGSSFRIYWWPLRETQQNGLHVGRTQRSKYIQETADLDLMSTSLSPKSSTARPLLTSV